MTGVVVGVAVWAVLLWTVGEQAVRAWSRGRFAARDRFTLVRSSVDAIVVLALVRAVLPPPGPLSWLWVAAAVVVGIGVAGAILRIVDGTRAQPGPPSSGRRDALAGLYAAAGALMLVALA